MNYIHTPANPDTHEPQINLTKAEVKQLRRDEATVRQLRRNDRTDQDQLNRLDDDGHSRCKEATRLADRIVAAS